MIHLFLPDQDSIRDLFGPWLDKGWEVYTEFEELRGWAVKVKFPPPSNAIPVWYLDYRRLATAEDAEAYFVELRDTHMVTFCGPLHPESPPSEAA